MLVVPCERVHLALAFGYYCIENRVMKNHKNLSLLYAKVMRKLNCLVAAMWKISWMQARGWDSLGIRDVPSQKAIQHLIDRLDLTLYTFTVRANVRLLGASILGIWAPHLGEVVQPYSSSRFTGSYPHLPV